MNYMISTVRNGRPVVFPFIYDEEMFDFALTLPEEEWRNATYYAVLAPEKLKDISDKWLDAIECELALMNR